MTRAEKNRIRRTVTFPTQATPMNALAVALAGASVAFLAIGMIDLRSELFQAGMALVGAAFFVGGAQ